MDDKDNTVEVTLSHNGYTARILCGNTVIDKETRFEDVEQAMNYGFSYADCGEFKIELFDGWSINSNGVFSKSCYGEFWPVTRESWEVWSTYGYHGVVKGNFFKCVEVLEMAYAEHEKAYKDMLIYLLGI